MGNAHATLTQAGLNIFSIEINVTVVLDPNNKKNYEINDSYRPKCQGNMSFKMYTSGTDINLPNLQYILDEVQETCWNIENDKEFMIVADEMYVYVKRSDNAYVNIETIDALNDNEQIYVLEYPHPDDLRSNPVSTLTKMKMDLGIIDSIERDEEKVVTKTEISPVANYSINNSQV
eukprot:g172.t1